MKTCSVLLSSAVAFLLIAGCSKQEPTADQAAADAQRAAEAARSEAQKAADALQQQAATSQQAAAKAAADAQAQITAAGNVADKTAADAQAQTTALTSAAQSKIDSASKLIAEKNWSEALKMLTELAGMKLTPEQQATVANLKAQAQKLMQDSAQNKVTGEANKALGDLLKK